MKQHRSGSKLLSKLKRSSQACTKIDNLHADTLVRDKHFAVTDEAELLVHGLPVEFKGTYTDAAKFILIALGFGQETDLPPILLTRDWTPLKPHNNQSQQQDGQPSNASALITKSFVFSVGIPFVRDRIIMNSARLAETTALEIFKVGGASKVHIRPLWPKPVHDLLIKTRAACETLGYPRPVVKNLRIFVRPNAKAEWTPIVTVNDLSLLQPNPAKKTAAKPSSTHTASSNTTLFNPPTNPNSKPLTFTPFTTLAQVQPVPSAPTNTFSHQ